MWWHRRSRRGQKGMKAVSCPMDEAIGQETVFPHMQMCMYVYGGGAGHCGLEKSKLSRMRMPSSPGLILTFGGIAPGPICSSGL